jgi:hypothetical protein
MSKGVVPARAGLVHQVSPAASSGLVVTDAPTLIVDHRLGVLAGESGIELVVLSATPGSPAEDGLRLLAGLGANSGDTHPTVNAQVRE